MDDSALAILTVGHSTLTTEAFLALLAAHGVGHVVDVRAYPGSRFNPQFARAALEPALLAAGVAYTHEGDLGGHRDPSPASDNAAIEDPALRAYADHTRTAAFRAAVARVLDAARARRVALLCAEARPRDCHRWLLADHLVGRGARVEHVLDPRTREAHVPTPGARWSGEFCEYPAAQTRLPGL